MSQVIADTYEIYEKIGAGGGGVVYLGKHLRLEKTIVLKADKRTLNTEMETLRREVDMLKDLNHTYIPQVYDFVQDNGVVYTVMDYIEGESWDKLLGRGEIPTQPEVIKWACQLLEALSYLHSRPPHGILHGDIKPANIMLRSNGDVCLIDYNIALALGEDGAVKVGFSRGYASPEHYGADYLRRNIPAAVGKISNLKSSSLDDETVKLDSEETGRIHHDFSSARSTTARQKAVLLDVRSDIYSLGATLYHMLSGCRPAEDAMEVKPLGAEICRPEVSAIIQKAMAPEPDMRYQTAEEMRRAFLQLHRNDKRTIRHKRRMGVSAAVLTAAFLTGGACSFIGLKQLEQMQKALTLAEYSANALTEGDVSEAVGQALAAIPTENSILTAPVTPQAQKALTDALGVYDLSDGFKALDVLELPAAPFHITVSPDGSHFAVVYAYEVAVFETENKRSSVRLPIQESALSDVIFIDESHIVYAGEQGVTAYDLNTDEVLWTGDAATTLTISADHRMIAAVNRDDSHAAVYRASDGMKIAEPSFDGLHMSVVANDIFADPEDDIFALNEDGSLLAVSFYNGGLVIFNLQDPDQDIIIYEESDYRHFEGGFYGKYFAFSVDGNNESEFRLIDTVDAVYLGGYASQDDLLLKTDERGIYLANGSLLVSLDPDTMEEKELAYTDKVHITAFSTDAEYVLVATDDNGFAFYDAGANLSLMQNCKENCDFVELAGKYAVIGNRNEASIRLMKLEDHPESHLLSYDARYPHDEARISLDGQTAMLFCYQNFCIYDMEGNLLCQMDLPDAGNIYDQQFVKSEEGSWLEVIWYDGMVRCYSAADGTLLSETAGEPPSKDLYEEFYTDKYRIASSLHGAPEVYDIRSGRLVATLEEDSYLTYVTQIEGYIMTEYISAAGERYGILLDNDLQKLAYLPGLCDITEDMLVFDYGSGNLRQCRLYSLQELIALGETYYMENK